MSGTDAARWEVGFECYDEEDELRREALLALGNGLLSCRASAPEAAAALLPPHDYQQTRYAGLYRSGWYDEAPREVNGRTVTMAALTNLPDPFGMSFRIGDGDWFDLPSVELLNYRQCLNLHDGTLSRSMHFSLGGEHCTLHELRLVSMTNPHETLLRWELSVPASAGSLRIRSTLDGSVRNALIYRNKSYEGERLQDISIKQTDQGRAAITAHLHDPERRAGVAVQTCVKGQQLTWTCHQQRGWLIQESDCTAPHEGPLVIEKRVIAQVDGELPADHVAAQDQLLARLPVADFDESLEAHRDAWHQLWERMPIESSDPELELALRLHSFHLMQTVSPHSIGHDLGCPPRTWQEGYYGQVFWDELFCFPFLSTHFPELALELLDYRYQRLDAARDRARQAGLRGAMFPWRSGRSGQDETPPFQFYPLSGHWIPDPTCLQRHISAAVAYDVWMLYLATGDDALLAGMGGELILETARFWGSIAQLDPERDRYVIRGVIGPDEYHNGYPDADKPGLDNNAYTNLMAVWNLDCALELLAMLPDDMKQPLMEGLNLTDPELRHWEDITRRMYLPFIEGAIGQFEGFEHLRKPAPEWLTDSRPRLDWMLEERGDTADRYQLTKQADGLMLLHLFSPDILHAMIEKLGYQTDEHLMQRTLDYHLSHITHESSLSKVVCAGACAALEPERSWGFFRETLGVDLGDIPDRGTAEGVHLGAMAGSLDVLQRHYLGIQPQQEGLGFRPAVPAELQDTTIGFSYRGARLQVTLTSKDLTLSSHAENEQPVRVLHAEGHFDLRPGQNFVLAR